jgi:branched-chain amino acid transport system ATP-binding protein
LSTRLAEARAGTLPALEVSEISVNYGGIRAVDDVSFAIAQGSITGLIGPNGAGKTTVFDAISGFAALERGRIMLGGREITKLGPSERARAGLGRSFQDARLFPSLTVFETLASAFERHVRVQDPLSGALGLPWVRRAERRIRHRVEELIDLMGLDAFRDKFVSELSTGSRRIVDLACVLAHDPAVLLLDEPSSGIAQKESEALGPLLLRVKASTGCTMLLIEHDMPLVTSVSDELLALETGRVIARGLPHEVTNDPMVVEAYLGTDQRIIARSGTVAEEEEEPKPKRSAARSRAPVKASADGKAKPARAKTTRSKSGAASRRSTSGSSRSRRAPTRTPRSAS